MHARVSTYSGSPEQTEEGIRNFEGLTAGLRALSGFEGAYLLVERGTGRALSITLWSSEEAAQASAEQARQMRDQAAGGAGMSIDSVDTYEVAVQTQPGG
jgi:heme-degrading monooxygenase HmoA